MHSSPAAFFLPSSETARVGDGDEDDEVMLGREVNSLPGTHDSGRRSTLNKIKQAFQWPSTEFVVTNSVAVTMFSMLV